MMNQDEFDLLATLNKNVDGLRRDVQSEEEIRSRQVALLKMVLAAAIVLVICGAIVNASLLIKVSNQNDQLADNQIEDCKLSNESRAAIVEAFGQYTAALISASSAQPSDPTRQERIDRFQADIAQRLAPLGPRDCSLTPVGTAGRS
jgi:hypothetical protein